MIVIAVGLGVTFLGGLAWDTAFEDVPAGTDPVAQGAAKIRSLKQEIRKRLNPEILFGTGTTNTGRLRPGAARTFVAASAPTVLGAVDNTSPTPTDALDAGRLWVDTTNVDTTGVQLNYYSGATWLPAAPVYNSTVGTVPATAIILWDSSSTCPPGYAEATEFRNLAIRGADTGTATTTIPDTAGKSCNGYLGTYEGALSTTCGAASVDAYSDVQTLNTLFSHSHSAYQLAGGSTYGGSGLSNWTTGQTTGTAGVAAPIWPGPFRTVIFCRKS